MGTGEYRMLPQTLFLGERADWSTRSLHFHLVVVSRLPPTSVAPILPLLSNFLILNSDYSPISSPTHQRPQAIQSSIHTTFSSQIATNRIASFGDWY